MRRCVAPGVDWPARLAALATVQVLALLWIVPQRKSVSGGDFAPYLATLPISRLTQRLVDLTLLLTADFFPLLAFGLAMAVLWNHGRDGIAEAVALFIVLETVLAAQTLILHARPVVLLALALTDALLTLGLAPGGHVPDSHGSIARAGRQPAAVLRREGGAQHAVFVT